MKTSIHKFTWRTNYGIQVAIIEALSKESAIVLLPCLPDKECIADGYEYEEITITNIERIISIDGE